MNKLFSATTLGENLIFIVGSPRSGTTYLRELISSFSGIQSGPESHLFRHVGPFMDLWHEYVKFIAANPDPFSATGLPVYLTYEEFTEIGRKLVSELMKPMIEGLKEGEFFLEKSPSHALHIHTIHELLPKARIIHILRDARDVVASLLAFSRKHTWPPNRVDLCAQIWCAHVKHVRSIAPSLPPRTFLELRYESLIDNPMDSLLAIADFLGMDWSEESIQAAIRINSIESMQAKLGKDNIRRGGYNYWKQDLNWWQKFRVWQVAASTMATVGYSWRFPW